MCDLREVFELNVSGLLAVVALQHHLHLTQVGVDHLPHLGQDQVDVSLGEHLLLHVLHCILISICQDELVLEEINFRSNVQVLQVNNIMV